MHERYAGYGSKGLQWAAYVEQLVVEDGHRTVPFHDGNHLTGTSRCRRDGRWSMICARL